MPIYWVWVGTTIQTNLREVSSPTRRLAMFSVALAGLFMALATPHAYGDRTLLFALAYWGARLVRGVPMVFRQRLWFSPYAVSMFLAGPLLIVGAMQHDSAREWCGASRPFWTSRRRPCCAPG